VKPLSADEVKAVCPMKVGCAKLLNLKPVLIFSKRVFYA